MCDRKRRILSLSVPIKNKLAVLNDAKTAHRIFTGVNVRTAAFDDKKRGVAEAARVSRKMAAHRRGPGIFILSGQNDIAARSDFKVAAGRTGLVVLHNNTERSVSLKNKRFATNDIDFGELEIKAERVSARCKAVIKETVRNVTFTTPAKRARNILLT